MQTFRLEFDHVRFIHLLGFEGYHMFNANASGHYKTLKGFTKSAEYSRLQLFQQVKESDGGIYKVKMEESDSWQVMDTPPAAGALEWLYINAAGVPLYYWKKGQEGLTII